MTRTSYNFPAGSVIVSDERVAIVTGASRGIGRAIAQKLASGGIRCVLTARDRGLLEGAVREITESGGDADAVPLDLREPTAPAALVTFAFERFGRIDIVINNAGATKRGDFLALSDEDFVDGFALKYFGSVRLIRAAWPYLKATKGTILNIIGVGGRTPGAAFAIGGSVNAALLSLTKALAAKGIDDGIRVNAINPGPIRTDRLKKRLSDLAAEEGIALAAAERHFIITERVTRIGEPSDVASLAAFIVGPEGSFLQGALVDLDGGSTKTI
jgi:3-oxoacyl-[acyl-carrier protein] reductase